MLRYLFCIFIIFSAALSEAALVENLTIGNPKALALAHSVTADPPGLDSIHFNPAGLSRINDRQYQVKSVVGSLAIDMSFGGYNEEQQKFIDGLIQSGREPSYYEDVAVNSNSEIQGVAVMLPGFGLTDMSSLVGGMGGFSYQSADEKFTFANAVYTPLAFGFVRDENDPGVYMGKKLALSIISYFTPSIAVQFNDQLSVGVAITASYIGLGIELPVRTAAEVIGFLGDLQDGVCELDLGNSLCVSGLNVYDQLFSINIETESSFEMGYNLGVLWSPVNWLSLGAVYQSQYTSKTEGSFELIQSEAFAALWGPLTDSSNEYHALISALGIKGGTEILKGEGEVKVVVPGYIAFGTSIRVFPQLKINLDYKRANWDTWKNLSLDFKQEIDYLILLGLLQPDLTTNTSVSFPLNFKNAWNASVGITYVYSDQIEFRMGYEDRPSSLSEDGNALLPLGEGHLFGLGFGYRLGSGASFDLAIGRLRSKLSMPGGTSSLGNSTDPIKAIYNPYPGTDIDVDVRVDFIEASYQSRF